jgi:hypothetical protein
VLPITTPGRQAEPSPLRRAAARVPDPPTAADGWLDPMGKTRTGNCGLLWRRPDFLSMAAGEKTISCSMRGGADRGELGRKARPTTTGVAACGPGLPDQVPVAVAAVIVRGLAGGVQRISVAEVGVERPALVADHAFRRERDVAWRGAASLRRRRCALHATGYRDRLAVCGLRCVPKKRTNSAEASGPCGSVWEPCGLPPDHA